MEELVYICAVLFFHSETSTRDRQENSELCRSRQDGVSLPFSEMMISLTGCDTLTASSSRKAGHSSNNKRI